MQPHEIDRIDDLLKIQQLYIKFVTPVDGNPQVYGARIIDHDASGILVSLSLRQGLVNAYVPWTNIAAIYPG